ncbi:MAG: UDP-galactopyranose mutase [Muribaculum sp.]|nr:UDP-galactopyranose mutase [Muribaculaceae bacterium]MCM1081460.1 UDP-galactopyranose mutase [Muribaculum sp.]
MKYDFLIVGSGLYGATFAHLAAKKGYKCLVIEKRDHLGGNIYCENIAGISVHKYGAHIFHTSDRRVWDFVNSLVSFNRYTNSPVAIYGNELYNLPFNMNTYHQMWPDVITPAQATERINQQRAEAVAKLGGRQPQNLEEQALTLVGHDIFEKLIKGYTEKQWGRPCDRLPAFIIKRLPVRMVYDNNYFNDLYQGIPSEKGQTGYNALINRLLEGIECLTATDFFADRTKWEQVASKIVFTGKIDEYFNYRFGTLDYRTVRFETETLDCPNYQGNAVVNYTERSVAWTRIIEHKHFESFGAEVYENPRTVISREYSTEWHDGMEPYYPVNDERNNSIYASYRALADKEPNVIFGGRLAEYKYYDMDDIVSQVLAVADRLL